MSDETLLTVNEVAKYLKVSRPTVYKLMDEGEIKYFVVGKRRRVHSREVDSYLMRKQGNETSDREGGLTPCVAYP